MCPILGASLALWLALNSLMVERLLESKAGQWLGTRSYSLYLVHEPIVVTIAFALGGRPELVAFLALVLPASLIAAELFWRYVENPSIKAARWLGETAKTVTWPRTVARSS
jgi:peptidoglycan/LPS O-acetylase OafA/YrhL